VREVVFLGVVIGLEGIIRELKKRFTKELVLVALDLNLKK